MSAVPFTPSIAIALFLMFFVLPLIIRSRAVAGTLDSSFTQDTSVHLNIQRSKFDSIKEVKAPVVLEQTIHHDNADQIMSQDPHIHSGKIYSIDIIDEEQEESNITANGGIVCNTAYYVVVIDRADSIEAAKAYTS